MKIMFITTVLGPDSPGIIKSLAHTTRDLGGEWLTSKVVKLDGQFSAIMRVVIDPDKEDALKAELKRNFPDLQFVYAPSLTDEDKPSKVMNLVVDCMDRAGLTKDITNILHGMDVVVESMEFNRAHVSSIGQAVFSAKLSICVRDDVSGDTVVEEIEGLSDDVRVTVS
jgi:glycine cleavage system regulatory protein